MFEKVFGKKKSIQRSLTIQFIISIVLVIIFSLVGFYLFIDQQTLEKLLQLSNEYNIEVGEVLNITRRGGILIIINAILISAIIIRISIKQMLDPIKKLNEATKKVAQGDFTVKLETEREDEIAELTANFNKMVDELGSNEQLQKEFIDNVSHEIKTPISSIQGFAELLEDDKLSQEERKEYVNIIKEESARVLSVSTNMLKLSKLQNQNRIINKKQFNVAEQIRRAVKLLETKWSEKEIIFDISLEEKYFIGDEELIFQIWVNLIENAIKFSDQKGKIEIALKEIPDFLEVLIKDHGIGMDEEEKDKIFARFYQVDKSHSTQGSGLGLAIVKRIIELSNGTIEVDSEKNVGTTMIVRLPIENVQETEIQI